MAQCCQGSLLLWTGDFCVLCKQMFAIRAELSFLQGIHFCNFHKVVDRLLTAFSFFI